MPYQNSFKTINYFKKIDHPLFNNQSIELSSSSENDNIIQEGEVIFKKKSTVRLPDVSKLTDSVMRKRQEDQSKHSFLEKENSIKAKWIHYEHPEVLHQLINSAMKKSIY